MNHENQNRGAYFRFHVIGSQSPQDTNLAQITTEEIQHIVERVLSQLGERTKSPSNPGNVVAIGADHGGYELKEVLIKDLHELGYEVLDVGTHNQEAVDYPDYAHEVAKLVGAGKAWRGVMIDGAGIGSCMTANKVPGVRAGMAYDHASAVNAREHNDANVLTLGAGMIGSSLARQILKTWLATEFGGGRHAKRVDKIIAIEKHYLK
jgi:ribose 5-phosphate isomerase B